jgi:hypothetical protein
MSVVWIAFCIFIAMFICVRLGMFCMTPPPPSCRHKMNMNTLHCQTCGAYAPFGYDGENINLESWPTSEDFDEDSE